MVPGQMTGVGEGNQSHLSTMSQSPRWKSPRVIALAIVTVGLVILFVTNKGLLIAGMVNGKPIFRWNLNKILVDRYGKQTLEQMISEELIVEEAAKQGVSVTAADINAKVADVTKGLGPNANLDNLLQYQGMSRSEFENQLRLQLMVQKVLGKDLTITEADVDNYIATNRALLAATEPAALREEARQTMLDNKIGEKLQGWFSRLKDSAKILRFL